MPATCRRGASRARFAALLRGRKLGRGLPVRWVALEGWDLTGGQGQERLRALLDQHRPRLLVLDAQIDFLAAAGLDENDPSEVQRLFNALRPLADAYQAAVLLLHHDNRNGEYRGASSMPGAVELRVAMASKARSPVIEFDVKKARDMEPTAFAASIEFGHALAGGDPIVEETRLLPIGKTALSARDLEVLAALAGLCIGSKGVAGATDAEWLAAATAREVPERSYYRSKEVLLATKLVVPDRAGRGARFVPTPEGLERCQGAK